MATKVTAAAQATSSVDCCSLCGNSCLEGKQPGASLGAWNMTVSVCEEMNPSRRNTMEDCYVVHAPGTWKAPDPELAYLAVYDGHGGRDMVNYLEHGLAHHVAQELSIQDNADICTRLERAFLMADVHAKYLGISTSGATVAICLIKNLPHTNQLQVIAANVGDARVVLGHGDNVWRLTHDHRADDPAEMQRIEKAGGFVFRGRVVGVLAISRSLGDFCMKEFVIAKPHVNTMALETNSKSVLIVACDGLWDVMTDEEAVEFCCNSSARDVATALVQEALRRGSTDNITAIVAWPS